MNYGFVQMAAVEQAEEVVQALDGCDLFGTLPYVARTYPRVSQERSRQQIYGAKGIPRMRIKHGHNGVGDSLGPPFSIQPLACPRGGRHCRP